MPATAGTAMIVGWAFAVLWPRASSALTIDSPTTFWTPTTYSGLVPDYYDDEQIEDTESDIVGDVLNPAVYAQFDDNGTPGDNSDDVLALRVRIGATKPPTGFTRFVGIGIDADQNGSLDLFLGADNGGGGDHLEIFDPGTDLNISPSTTSIETASPIPYTYAEDATNFDWSPIDAILDRTAISFDLDSDGNTDHFVSWAIPFQDVIDQLAANGILGFDESTPVSYVAGTSTQSNAFNQDLARPQGGTTSSESWAVLGALSDPITISGVPVAEPDSCELVALDILGLTALRRRGLL